MLRVVSVFCTLITGAWASFDIERDPVPPFLDFDCDLAHTIPGATADWNVIYNKSVPIMTGNLMDATFALPRELEDMVLDDGSTHRFQSKVEQARKECPSGYLYLKLLHFYNDSSKLDVEAGEVIQQLMGLYPTHVMALSRWPIFSALAYFRDTHRVQNDVEMESSITCSGVKGVINWDESRELADRWVKKTFVTLGSKTDEDEEEIEDLQVKIAAQFYMVLRKAADRQERATEECPFGFFYLSATQLVAAAGKGTNHMPPFNRVMDEVVKELPFLQVSSSPWPVWHVLAIFADMNKGDWFFGGDRKYFRGFSDWNLRRDELSPLVSPSLDFLSEDWRTEAMWKVEALKKMDHLSYIQALQSWTQSREESWGQLRPIASSIIHAACMLAARAHKWQLKTRLAYVVLLYGDSWAQLLQRMVSRISQLNLDHPLLVIAIGDAAPVCRRLSGEDVICWVPDTASQVHRFTSVQGLLHLGIDVIYMDMDTFLLRDPTQRFEAAAQNWDALFARHGDGDCINIGIFYIKASGKTAVWMSQFLAWYHDHPFEIDQRGLHVFLGLPAEVLQVMSVPDDLVHIRGSVLEDLNEVVIGDIGWVGSLTKMLIFHWCQRPLELKVREMNLAYDGADALEDHELPLSVALSVAAGAVPGSPWAKVVAVKFMFERYQTFEAPARNSCW